MGGIALGRLPEFLDRILNILEEIYMCPLDPTVRLEETSYGTCRQNTGAVMKCWNGGNAHHLNDLPLI